MTAVVYLTILVALSGFALAEAAKDIDGMGKEEEKEKEENGSGVTDVIAKYINEMNGRLESVELKYGRMENNYAKLNNKILAVENNAIRCESGWTKFTDKKAKVTFSRAFNSPPKFMAALNRFAGNAHAGYGLPTTTGVNMWVLYTVAGTYEVTWMACGN